MKVKLHDDDCNECTLNQTERRGIRSAIATCDQLAYHYQGSVFGDGMALIVSKLKALLQKPNIAPPPSRAEPEEESPGDK